MANAIKVGGGAATIGPQDPDNTAGLTAKLGAHNKTEALMKRHEKNWPLALVQALSLPKDLDRTKALDSDEVHEALLAVPRRQQFFREADKLLDMAVRGLTPGSRIVSVTFEVPSGRVACGVIPYKHLTKSQRAFAEQETAAAGVAQAAAPVIQTDEAAKAQLAAEQQRANTAVDEAANLKRELADLSDQLDKARTPEPFEGYDTLKAAEIVDKIKEGGVLEFGLLGLERIEAYEQARPQESGGPRVTVLRALEAAAENAPTVNTDNGDDAEGATE